MRSSQNSILLGTWVNKSPDLAEANLSAARGIWGIGYAPRVYDRERQRMDEPEAIERLKGGDVGGLEALVRRCPTPAPCMRRT